MAHLLNPVADGITDVEALDATLEVVGEEAVDVEAAMRERERERGETRSGKEREEEEERDKNYVDLIKHRVIMSFS